MKITCAQANLAKGITTVSRAVATRTTLPILSNILIETDDSRVKLSATNLEIGINCWIGARVEEGGATTVPARLLGEFVNSVPGEQVTLELNGKNQTLKLSSGRDRAEIKGIDASDFPILPTVEQGTNFSLDPEPLREMISQVVFAAASDESRPILTGVLALLDPDTGRMTLAAADGFRLSVRTAELDSPLDGKIRVIIPARALLELGRISADETERIQVSITENRHQMLFRLSNTELVTQLIDGNFPDYEKIMPTSHTTRAVLNTKALLNAVRIASYFARDAANVVRLSIQPGAELQPGTVVVSAQASEVGGNQSELEASIEGEALEVAFNAKYLLDMLGVMGADQVALELNTPSSPGLFRPVADTPFSHVIMPMNVPRA